MTQSAPFEVRSGDDIPPAQLVGLLSESYGEPFTEEWLQWKHREGPWGPSRIWIAADDEGMLGVVFGLPWRYWANRAPLNGARLVDGGSTPRSRGRGVFRGVVAKEIAHWEPAMSPGILVATATPEAQGAHVKNGAAALAPIRNGYGFVANRRRAQLVNGEEVLDGYATDDSSLLSTGWDGASLRWRTDPRSGHRYDAARLAQAAAPNGLVYRVTIVRGLRILVLALVWGVAAEVRALVGAVARAERAHVALGPSGPGAAPQPVPALVHRGGTALLCVWSTVGSDAINPGEREGWALSGVDVEGVI